MVGFRKFKTFCDGHQISLASTKEKKMKISKENFSKREWDDHSFHMKNLIRSEEDLEKWIYVSDEEREAIRQTESKYLWMITPYYASLMDKHNQKCPIRLQAIPHLNELNEASNSDIDPVGDTVNLKTRRVVHKYPNRIVLLVSDTCPVYCRHCTRKFHTTSKEGTYFDKSFGASYDEDFEYIRNHPEIDDVLLTGGDPLILSDSKLEFIIKSLREIPHVNIIRIGSRYPALLPQRITDEFCKMLDKYHPVWFNTHFNHPVEITEEAAAACDRLIRNGVPVQNQSVLLKDVNDSPEVMRQLLKQLLAIRVRPYYLYHCDNVTGVSHFRTTLSKGRNLMRSLRGFETGFSVPNYVVTTSLGKIPINDHDIKEDGKSIIASNYKGQTLDITEYIAVTDLDLDGALFEENDAKAEAAFEHE